MSKRYSKLIFIILLAGFFSFYLSGCLSNENYTDETYTIESEKAKKVTASISIYTGDIAISGNSQQPLLTSEFNYNLKQFIPKISYVVQNDEGKLKISQEEKTKGLYDSVENRWILIFNRTIPLELNIAMGSGDNRLDLSDINLTGLKSIMGSGDSYIDLTGKYKDNVHVYLIGGLGHTTINLPEDIGIRLLIDGVFNRINCSGFEQIGNFYFNSGFDLSERKIYITIISGIGKIDVNLI